MVLLINHTRKMLATVDTTAWSIKKPMFVFSLATKENKTQIGEEQRRRQSSEYKWSREASAMLDLIGTNDSLTGKEHQQQIYVSRGGLEVFVYLEYF
jgi:hypothetical protein